MGTPHASLGVPLRRRRNLRLMLVGVLAICLGGLGAAVLYSSLSGSVAVVAVKRTVHRDQVISADDLTVLHVPPVPGLETVPSRHLEEIAGTTALADLTAGQLLSPRSWGEPVAAPGRARLGLRLTPGRLPVKALPPGSPVLLVPVARDGGEPPLGASILGEAASLPVEQADGAVVLDVTVPLGQAERLARLAAADQVVLVRQPGGAP